MLKSILTKMLPKALLEIKWFFQRLFRGYDDTDMIDFGEFVCRKVLPYLKKWVESQKKEAGPGYPEEFGSFDEWKYTLDEIVWAVEETAYGREEDSLFDEWERNQDDVRLHKRLEELWARTENGMILFGKYLSAMWE